MSPLGTGVPTELAVQLSVLLDTASKRELATQLVSAWRAAGERLAPIHSLSDLLPAKGPDCTASCSARALIEVARLAASVADVAGRDSSSEGLRALCRELGLRNSSGAARLQRQLLWESR